MLADFPSRGAWHAAQSFVRGSKTSAVFALWRTAAWHVSQARCGSLCEKRACWIQRVRSTGGVATRRPFTVLSSWQTVHFALITCSALTMALSLADGDH